VVTLKVYAPTSESSGRNWVEEGRMRRFFVGCAIVVLGLMVSACDLRAEISVNDDGSGTMGVVFLVEPQYLSLMSQSGVDPFAEMKTDLANDPVPWKVEDLKEGASRGVRATFPFSSVEELQRRVEELGRDSGSSSSTGIEEDFTLTRKAGGWAFEGKSTDVQEQTGEDFPIPAEQLATLVTLQFRVTLPGRAASNNASETTSSGGRTTFIWKPSVNDRSVNFVANTTAAGSGFPVLPVGLGAAVIGIAVVIGILRGRGSTPPVEGSVPVEDVEAFAAPAPTDQNSP
jgi:hypothetical protein